MRASGELLTQIKHRYDAVLGKVSSVGQGDWLRPCRLQHRRGQRRKLHGPQAANTRWSWVEGTGGHTLHEHLLVSSLVPRMTLLRRLFETLT